jgi:hypothetical protein
MIVADNSMIGEILNLDLTGKYTLGIVERMRLGKAVILLEDNARACVGYDPLAGDKKWVGHILSARSFRGRVLWDFTLDTMLWMVEERGMEYMLNFVDDGNRQLKMFVGNLPMDNVATIGEESLYVSSAEQIKTFASEKEV